MTYPSINIFKRKKKYTKNNVGNFSMVQIFLKISKCIFTLISKSS